MIGRFTNSTRQTLKNDHKLLDNKNDEFWMIVNARASDSATDQQKKIIMNKKRVRSSNPTVCRSVFLTNQLNSVLDFWNLELKSTQEGEKATSKNYLKKNEKFLSLFNSKRLSLISELFQNFFRTFSELFQNFLN